MDLAAFLVLPVVGGYALTSTWTASLYRTTRESGERLYFRLVFYAVFLVISAIFLHIILFLHSSGYSAYLSLIAHGIGEAAATVEIFGSPAQISILLLSMVLGSLLGHGLNFHKFYGLRNRPLVKAWDQYLLKSAIKDNDFELLIFDSIYRELPLMLTLTGGKVYVGWAVRAPNPVEERKAIRIQPLVSGYRDENQEVVFTTDYLDVLKKVDSDEADLDHLALGDFEIVLPADQITCAHLFDMEAYSHFASADEACEEQAAEENAQRDEEPQPA